MCVVVVRRGEGFGVLGKLEVLMEEWLIVVVCDDDIKKERRVQTTMGLYMQRRGS